MKSAELLIYFVLVESDWSIILVTTYMYRYGHWTDIIPSSYPLLGVFLWLKCQLLSICKQLIEADKNTRGFVCRWFSTCSNLFLVFETDLSACCLDCWRKEGSLNSSPPGGNLSLVLCFLPQFLMFTKTNWSHQELCSAEKNPATYKDKLILVYTKITAYLLIR